MWQQPPPEFRQNSNNNNNNTSSSFAASVASAAAATDDNSNFGYTDRNYQSQYSNVGRGGGGWKNDREASFKNSSRYASSDCVSDENSARNFSNQNNNNNNNNGKYRERSPRVDRRDDRKRRRYRSSRSYSRSRSRSRSNSRSRSKGSPYYRGGNNRRSSRDDNRYYYHYRDSRRNERRSSCRDNTSPSSDDRDSRRRNYYYDNNGNRDRNTSRAKDDWLSHVWSEGYRDEILEIDRHNEQYRNDHQQYHPQQDRRYRSHSPNRTIILRGLSTHITEEDIREQVVKTGILPKDVRLIKKKDTGCSRGFAFIEFHNVDESKFVMDAKEGELKFPDNYKIPMQYSIQKDPDRDMAGGVDWYCKCSALNFKRREHCYRCGSDRKSSECGESTSDEVSTHPTHTVILKGLDVLTTEEGVLKAIQSSSSLPIRSVRIGRDKLTNISRGICYLEMNNVSDAMYLHNTLLADNPTIDGKHAMVLYSKINSGGANSNNNSGSSITSSSGAVCKAGDAAVAAAQWSHRKSETRTYTLEDVSQLAEYSANLYAKSSPDKELYVKHYTDYYTKVINEGGIVPSLDAIAANPSQTGFNNSSLSQITTSASSTPTPDGGNSIGTVMMACAEPPSGDGEQTYPVPDVSTYQYDKTSGYYYDPFTTLYYDANSQYYYNSKLNKFLYWDGFKKTFLSAPTNVSSLSSSASAVISGASTVNNNNNNSNNNNNNSNTSTGDQEKKEDNNKRTNKSTIDDKDKVKVAKRIAKDMEKWAKTLNQKKEVAKMNIVAQAMPLLKSSNAAAADIGYTVLGRKDNTHPNNNNTNNNNNNNSNNNSFLSPSSNNDGLFNKSDSLVPDYGRGSDSEDEQQPAAEETVQQILDKLIDWNKIACLLCKRQFPNKDTLIKHQQLSDLHKQNLESYCKSTGINMEDSSSSSSKLNNVQYRDRAKERRIRHNEPENPRPSKLKETYLKTKDTVNYEQPTNNKIGGDNLGNKLLQKMGWQEGMGLGKSNQGRTDIIQAQTRITSAGLGSRNQGVTPGPGESYKECVKKMMRHRYDEIDLS